MADLDLAELRRLAFAADHGDDPTLADTWALGRFHDALTPAAVLQLVDRLEAAAAHVDTLERGARAEKVSTTATLRQMAAGRREYAEGAPDPDRSLLLHEAQTLDNVADALCGRTTWPDLVASIAPSWRWPEFGQHAPGAVAGEPGGEQP